MSAVRFHSLGHQIRGADKETAIRLVGGGSIALDMPLAEVAESAATESIVNFPSSRYVIPLTACS